MIQAVGWMGAQAAGSYERLFGLDLQLLQDALFTGISVFILFFVLSYLLFNPVREILKKRQEKIRMDLNQAEGDREEARRLKDLYEQKQAHADREAEDVLKHARKRASQLEAERLRQAEQAVGQMQRRASAQMELEKKRAMHEMRKEIMDIAAWMAQKAVSANMTEPLQDALIKETLEEMGDETWRSS